MNFKNQKNLNICHCEVILCHISAVNQQKNVTCRDFNASVHSNTLWFDWQATDRTAIGDRGWFSRSVTLFISTCLRYRFATVYIWDDRRRPLLTQYKCLRLAARHETNCNRYHECKPLSFGVNIFSGFCTQRAVQSFFGSVSTSNLIARFIFIRSYAKCLLCCVLHFTCNFQLKKVCSCFGFTCNF